MRYRDGCPAGLLEFAEKGVLLLNESYKKLKSVAEEASNVMEAAYVKAFQGASDCGLKVIEAARANSNSIFELCKQLMMAK